MVCGETMFVCLCLFVCVCLFVGRLSAGTKQRARPETNRNTLPQRKRRVKRYGEREEVGESQDQSSAGSCGSEVEGESVSSCEGAAARGGEGPAGFIDCEAEEVWSCESGDEGSESGDEGSGSGDEGSGSGDEGSESGDEGSGSGDEGSGSGDEGSGSGDEGMVWSGSGESGDDEFVLDQSREVRGHERQSDGSIEMSGNSESDIGDIGESGEGTISEGGGGGDELPGHLRWKEGLSVRARDGYRRRQSSSKSLHTLIYSDPLPQTTPGTAAETEEEEEEEDGLGGLFQLARRRQQESEGHSEDSSLVTHTLTRDWSNCVGVVKDALFVTGDWGSEDAATLLREDQGEFEDLETGERFGQQGTEREEEERVKKKKEQKVI